MSRQAKKLMKQRDDKKLADQAVEESDEEYEAPKKSTFAGFA
jgi:hypothetical protein